MCEEMNVMEMINNKNSDIEYFKTTGFFGGFMAPIVHPPYGSLGSELYAFESSRHPICLMNYDNLKRRRLPNEIIEDIQTRLTTREYRYLVETRVGSPKEEIVKFRDILTKLIDTGVFDPVEAQNPTQFVSYPVEAQNPTQFVSYPLENNKGCSCVSTNETTETTKQEETVDTNGVDERLKTWGYVEPTDADKECNHSCDCKNACDCKKWTLSESDCDDDDQSEDDTSIVKKRELVLTDAFATRSDYNWHNAFMRRCADYEATPSSDIGIDDSDSPVYYSSIFETLTTMVRIRLEDVVDRTKAINMVMKFLSVMYDESNSTLIVYCDSDDACGLEDWIYTVYNDKIRHNLIGVPDNICGIRMELPHSKMIAIPFVLHVMSYLWSDTDIPCK